MIYDQVDANGEGGAELALVPVDATGTVGPLMHWSIVNGLRPAAM